MNALRNEVEITTAIRRLHELQPDLDRAIETVKVLYSEQVELTEMIIKYLKDSQEKNTSVLNGVIQHNSDVINSQNPRQARRPPENALSSLFTIFTGLDPNSITGNINRLTTSELSQFPLLEFSSLPEGMDRCTICQEDFSERTGPYRKLSCNHIFHSNCIDNWLTNESAICPVCLRNMRSSIR